MSAPATTSQGSVPPTRAPSPTATLAGSHHKKPSVELATPSPATANAVVASGSASEDKWLGGSGTAEDPYVVGWAEGEAADPYNWSKSKKWVITFMVALDTLCIAFASSAYSGGVNQIARALKVTSSEIMILGISLYVLGFGAGPLVWAGASEMYGRRLIFLISYLPFTLFHIGGATANNIQTIIITRFFAGFFGSAPLTNSGGVIADIWSAQERGLASALFALAPFLGPVLGPIVGGYTAPSGWRNVFWVMFAFAAATYIVSYFLVPETYAPTLLRSKAKALHKSSGGTVFYKSKFDAANTMSKSQLIKLNLTRPFVLLFKEPIVLMLSLYTALIYAVLYCFFAAFPIVFQKTRGWNSGQGGLAFLGIGLGMIIATAMAPLNNGYYLRQMAKSPTGRAPPEARLLFAMIGSVLLPIGLFWFAWTSDPHVHFIAPILAGVPFGAGLILVFTSIIGYLIDVYLMYAASALAANAILRSLLGAAFPLFTRQMYARLGNAWASSLIGFLCLACVPMPFVFYFYGERIRALSTFSPTGKASAPVPAATSSSAPVISEKDPSAAPTSAPAARASHEVDAYEQEYNADAGMAEQRAQDEHELERRRTGDRIV